MAGKDNISGKGEIDVTAKRCSRALALLLVLTLALGLCPLAGAQSRVETAAAGTAGWLYQTAETPQPGYAGGEWVIVGLARSGLAGTSAYYNTYAAALEEKLRETDGVLSARRNTEYSRTILALSALGRCCTDVAGYNLLLPLGDYDKTVQQGVNGAIYALLALDSAGYEIPVNTAARTQATRELYLAYILNRQHADGGFGLKEESDPDVTAMALQALRAYRSRADVADAIARAVDYLSVVQDADGGYSSWGSANTESTAQVILALCALDISPEDTRFVKNGHTVTDALLYTRLSSGGFAHKAGEGADMLATEQAMLALTALLRQEKGQTFLYDMRDVPAGLPGKNTAVHQMPVTLPGADFSDLAGQSAAAAIRMLAAREIVDGYADGSFLPGKSMTRAEFAAIVVRALGLTPKTGSPFKDVSTSQWYAAYIGTAYAFGIVDGVTDDRFNPTGTITRQEAAIMVCRAARLCGLDVSMTAAETAEILAAVPGGGQVSGWAADYAAWCCKAGVLDAGAQLRPKEQTLRGEMAQMLAHVLEKAALL